MTYLNLGLTNLVEYIAKGAESTKHTISFLSDLQRFRTVLDPGTQSRSCCHYITGTEPVESVSAQLSLCGWGAGRYLLKHAVASGCHGQCPPVCGGIEMKETAANDCVSSDSNGDNMFFFFEWSLYIKI